MASAAAVGVYTTAPKIRPSFTGAVLAIGDLAAVALTIALAVAIRQVFNGNFHLAQYWHLWPLLALFGATYSLFGLYPGIAMSPIAELRTTTYATTLVYLGLGALTFVFRIPFTYSRGAFLASWLVSLFAVPLTRAVLRSALRDKQWWGYRTVIMSVAGAGQTVVETLAKNAEIGLRAVAIFDNELQPGSHIHGVPVVGGLAAAPAFAERAGIKRAILAMPDSPPAELLRLIDLHAKTFSRVFMMPGLNGLSSIGVEIRDMSRMLALELRKSLLMTGPRAAKRSLDLVLSLAALIFLTPVLLLIAVLIRLESRGPALYSQSRVGLGRGRFRVWKFRTMCLNADHVLEDYLAANPALRVEWERDHKLKRDPRVTWMGRFLRKTSLDELPQLINVLRGEMSLVGPRPIVDGEIEKYGESFGLYTQVVPGLTGLWQVSGRNDTTYQERVELDTYYVRNWSPWLDIYLLARTVKVVITGYGAY